MTACAKCFHNHCDNPPCVNPLHLFVATHAENMRDMAEKGRQARGERNAWATLNAELVLEIRTKRAAGAKAKDLAAAYGIPEPTIYGVCSHQRWAHVGGPAPKPLRLSREKIAEILALHASGGLSQKDIGEMSGVHYNTVGLILRGEHPLTLLDPAGQPILTAEGARR